MRVSVIGGGRVSESEEATAREVGRLLGERGHTVVCGGLGGVMAAACEGARKAGGATTGSAAERANGERVERTTRERGGETVGILPGEDPAAANPYVSTPIATGMGNARNVLVALNGDATIAVSGSTGTLSEIGHALDFGRPVAGIDTHDVPGVEAVESAEEAVEYVEREVGIDE